ncbi:DNA cytosine methyltransferase [Paenibacillus amylolyticus]|uniref:Cytosine-specific methyltransferase n=1 Tax=Paenibacillus amylolyticus TaxID=1451 RepID=A0A117I2H6_PAEAM|nr:DNA cytosine methyltransferase [Paenibacillus amylolyticus]GAS83750.1 cytosine-specific methyltransferase [Paenibacillus amylolyticus]
MENNKPKKINTLELFVGCGGLLDGFEQSGMYETIASVEWAKQACTTLINRLSKKYKYENAQSKVLHFDIQRTHELINGWKDDEKFGTNKGLNWVIGDREIDLIIGGPPCQAYSMAGRIQDKDGMRYDYRNYLFESYLKMVKIYKPKMIVFENVEGMLSASPDGVNIVDKIKQGFNDHGFDIIDDIRGNALIDLSEYGIPQKRKRVILVGLSRDHFSDENRNQSLLLEFYNNTLAKYKSSTIATVYDAIHDLPSFYPIKEEDSTKKLKFSHTPTASSFSGHTPRFHNKRDIEIFRTLAEDIKSGNSRYLSAVSLKQLYTEMTGKNSNVHKYFVLRWDQPSNTIPAHLKKDGLRHIHPDPDQARSITVREAARLQTFDDDFEFLGSMVQNYEMIGNAVPPKFAKLLATAVNELLQYTKLV